MSLITVLLPLAAQAQNAGSAAFDWTGYYAGLHAGWLRADVNYREPDFPGFEIHPKFDGFQGGLLLGYNQQINHFVVGLAGDGGLTTAKHGANASGGNGYSAFKLNLNGHFRGRLGFALPYRTLVFATFGLAVAKLKLNDVDPGFGKDDAYLAGWTLGGGLEHAISEHRFLRLEFLHDDYGHASYKIKAPPASVYFPSYRARTDVKTNSVRFVFAWLF
jgi:outer membrane immunogenic protein